MPPEALITLTLVCSRAARDVREVSWPMPAGSTLAQALASQAAQALITGMDLSETTLGVWGRKAGLSQVLRDQDRIEIYRPLKVNPKVARRERFAKQGARTTGLFAKKRAGAKAGY